MNQQIAIRLLGVLTLIAPSFAAQVGGTVRGDDGTPVAGAFVSVIFQPGAGVIPSGADVMFHRTAQTATDGSYSVTGIPAGTYRVCAQAPSTDWLNTCLWTATPPVVTLTANQSLAYPVTMTRGHRLAIRIEDAAKYLRKDALTAPAGSLQVGVFHPNGLYTAANTVASDDLGQDEEVLIPFDTDLTISVSSAKVALADEKGKPLGRDGGAEKTRINRGQAGKAVKFQVTGAR